MIKSTLHTLRLNARILERIKHFLCDFLAPDIGIFLLVVMTRESVETKPQSDQEQSQSHN
jgi:hypothetical protein